MRRSSQVTVVLLSFAIALTLAWLPPLGAQVAADEFYVQSVMPFTPGSDRYDVKIRNKRTGYVHSVTVTVEVAITLKVGDVVRERRDGGKVILEPVGGRPKLGDKTPPKHDPPKDDGAVTTYRFPVGVVCWIDAQHLPFVALEEELVAALAWQNRVIIGLEGTANSPPPHTLVPSVQKILETKQYRAVLWCQLQVDVDRATDRITQCQLTNEVLDPGWTPPFDIGKFKDKLPLELLKAVAPPMQVKEPQPGELSPISKIYTRQQHPNSPTRLPPNEQVVADGLIKFRAGKHTDEVGIRFAGSPFHVPWAWSALAVTYAGKREFHVYTRGAIFPSHRWYVAGVPVRTSLQTEVEMSDNEPTLTIGAPARIPQPEDDSRPGTPVWKHRYTLPSGKQQAIPLGLLPRGAKGH